MHLALIAAVGALGSAFIPTFARTLAADDPRGAWRLASAVINIVTLILAAAAALAAIFAPATLVTSLTSAVNRYLCCRLSTMRNSSTEVAKWQTSVTWQFATSAMAPCRWFTHAK